MQNILNFDAFYTIMDEIEVKILEIDVPSVEEKLKLLGAEKKFDGPVETIFFDNGTLKDQKKIVRLRKMGLRSFFTYKQKISQDEVKIYDEEEVEISDFDVMKNALEKLGYRVKKHILKNRISYHLNGTKFEIDQFTGAYSFFPPFIEIEAESQEKIYELAEKLGFSKEQCTAKSTSDLVKYYTKELKH
jgi:adenylate cyclase class 2